MALTRIARPFAKLLRATPSPLQDFHSNQYLRHTQRRLEHLASLGLDLSSKTVLEVGAGIGDHTHFFLDRQCRVVTSEARLQNLHILKARYPTIAVRLLDLNAPDNTVDESFDLIYCYGVLYHLERPAVAIAYMSRLCQGMLLMETCVSIGEGSYVNLCDEDANVPSQSTSGVGCRPTREWVYDELGRYFDHVYMPVTQPFDPEFPIDWTVAPKSVGALSRSIFVASRQRLDNDLLFEGIPTHQTR